MLHALKTEQEFFALVSKTSKTFDVRKNDRPFQVNDDICLQEWDKEKKAYTGNEWHGKISYILNDERFCKKGYVVLAIKPKEIKVENKGDQ